MMRKINISALSLSLALSIGQLSFAQPGNPAIHALDIGDTLPDITLPVANFHSPTIHFQDLKGKLVILDFWNIRCGSCIAAMPEMQALQRQFNDRIQIITVTTDSIFEVQKLALHVKIIDTLNLPSIMQDSSLLLLFPMKTVPTHVWISPEGKVEYITNGYNSNEKMIAAYLRGEKPKLAIKREIMDMDFRQPLWSEGNGRHLDKMLYYSYLTSQIQIDATLVSIVPDRLTRQVTSIKAINTTKLSLFQMAMGHSSLNQFNQTNRVILDVHESETYLWPTDDLLLDDWKTKNLYCYEIQVKPQIADRIFTLMQQDLENLFSVKATIEKRNQTCWVLVRAGGAIAGQNQRNPIQTNSAFTELMYSVQEITRRFKEPIPPLMDETGLSENKGLQFVGSVSDLNSLREALKPYGIYILVQKREIDMLVIRDHS